MSIFSDTNYYYGHGQVWLGTRTLAGAVLNYDIPIPEVDSLKITLTEKNATHTSKRESLESDDLDITIGISASGELICSTHTMEMLALYLYGTVATVAGGAFIASAAIFPSGLVVGGNYPVPGARTNLSSFSIIDSTVSPVTATLGQHYSVDLHSGVVTILDLTGLTQPLKAAGTEAAATAVGGMTGRQYERVLLYKSLNVADGDKKGTLKIHKIKVSPASEWGLINDGSEVNKYTIPFKILKDTTIDPATATGQYFLWKQAIDA